MVVHIRVVRNFFVTLGAVVIGLTSVASKDDVIEKRIQAFMDKTDIPGLSVAIIRPNKPDYVRGFGKRSVQAGLLVDDHTIFKLNSVTKSMTATAAAAFVDKDEMQWDSRIIDYYPEFQLSDPWVTKEITFEDALSHRVGVEATDWMEDVPHLKLKEAIQRMRYLPQVNSFRAKYMYDNFTYSVAGEAAATLSGNWDKMMEDNLFTPLKMTDSITRFEGFIETDEIAPCHECDLSHKPKGLQALTKTINIAAPHAYVNGNSQLVHWRYSNSLPAGGVWASAHDMAQYLKLYLGAGELDGRRILSRKAMQQLTMPRNPIHLSAFEDKSQNTAFDVRNKQRNNGAYALGWGTANYMGHTMIHHDGSSIDFQSAMIVLPEDGLAVAIMANISQNREGLVARFALDLMDHYLKLPSVDWVGNRLQQLVDRHEDIELDILAGANAIMLDNVELYTGTYHHAAYGDITVELKDGKHLLLSQGKTRWGLLQPQSVGVFELTWNGVRSGPHKVTFVPSVEGRMTELRLRGQNFVRQ